MHTDLPPSPSSELALEYHFSTWVLRLSSSQRKVPSCFKGDKSGTGHKPGIRARRYVYTDEFFWCIILRVTDSRHGRVQMSRTDGRSTTHPLSRSRHTLFPFGVVPLGILIFWFNLVPKTDPKFVESTRLKRSLWSSSSVQGSTWEKSQYLTKQDPKVRPNWHSKPLHFWKVLPSLIRRFELLLKVESHTRRLVRPFDSGTTPFTYSTYRGQKTRTR